MKLRKIIFFVAILFLFTGIAAVVHLGTRQEVPENALKVTVGDKEYLIDIEKLEYKHVEGIRVNGKGEEIPVEGQGVRLQEVLEDVDITKYSVVSAISDDSYSASLSVEEVLDAEKAFLLCQEEEGLRMVVFGDENSKRSVSNIVQIIIK